MATLTVPNVSFNWGGNTLAEFKSWSMAISSAFSTMGWVQTADTGQVNWATQTVFPNFSSPYGGTAGLYPAYEMWRMNDALQATTPCFVKIEYGGGLYGNTPGFQLTIGGATDGAGKILGPNINRLLTPDSSGVAQLPCMFSGGTSRLSGCMWLTAPDNRRVTFSISRTKNQDLTDNGDGVVLHALDMYPSNGYGLSRTTSVYYPAGNPQSYIGPFSIPVQTYTGSGGGGTQTFDFNGTLPANWSTTNITVSSTDGGTTTSLTATSGDPILMYTFPSGFDPSRNYIVTVRLKMSGTAGWNGSVFYGNAGHGYSASYQYTMGSAPTAGNWVTIVIDMSKAPTASDFFSRAITSFRLDFGAITGSIATIDWIKFSSPLGNDKALLAPNVRCTGKLFIDHSILVYDYNDFTFNTLMTVNVNGVDHQYLALANERSGSLYNPQYIAPGLFNTGVAMLWE